MDSNLQNDGWPWAALIPHEAGAALAERRFAAGGDTEAAAVPGGQGWWLRGRGGVEPAQTLLRAVAGAQVFALRNGKLIRAGERLPGGAQIPDDLEWRKLRAVFLPEAPAWREAVPPADSGKISVLPERGGPEREAGLLLMPLTEWANWVETAPEVRLRRLRFAASPEGRAAVRGNPLPDVLKARRFFLDHGVAAPCGWTWKPEVPAAVLAEALGIAPGAVALLHETGEREDIPAEAWVPANRAAVRATLEASGLASNQSRSENR